MVPKKELDGSQRSVPDSFFRRSSGSSGVLFLAMVGRNYFGAQAGAPFVEILAMEPDLDRASDGASVRRFRVWCGDVGSASKPIDLRLVRA